MNEKRSISTFLWVVLILAIAAGIAFYLYPVKKELKNKQKELRETQDELHRLRKQQNRRQMENHALKTTPAAIEKVAREKFDMVRKDESVIRYSKDAGQKWQERMENEKKLKDQ